MESVFIVERLVDDKFDFLEFWERRPDSVCVLIWKGSEIETSDGRPFELESNSEMV